MANKKNNKNTMSSYFDSGDSSGMLSSLEIMDSKDKVDFIKKLLNMILMPTTHILSAMSEDKINISELSMIMTMFASVHLDCDLHNLTILEDNVTTRMMQDMYKRNGFYAMTSGPVIDKKTKEVCILMEFYKKSITDPISFLDDVKDNNAEILGYLYMKELVGIAQKNYRNKFTLANRARVYLFEHNPSMDPGMRDDAAIALAKMAMEYHLNSMLLDNFTIRDKDNYKLRNNLEYIKKSSMVLYDERYKYTMTHLEILEELLKDANIEFMNIGGGSSTTNTQQNNPASNKQPSDTDTQSDSNDQQDQQSDSNEKGDQQQSGQDQSGQEGTSGNDAINGNSAGSGNGEESDSAQESDSGDNAGNQPSLDRNSAYDKEDHEGKLLKITFKSNKNKIHFIKLPPQRANDRYDRLDDCDETNIDSYQDNIDYAVSKLKGSGVQNILSKIGCPIEIDMAWEEKIIKYVDDITNISTSHKEIATWAKVNIYTRHIATLPGRKPLPESHPTIYLMFDQSGSMSNQIIRKINYVIKYFYDKKYKINVFVHDYAQTVEDVEAYEFSWQKKDTFELEQLITSRVKSGGTSHKGVFDLMAQYIEDVKTRGNKKYNSHYVLIASDLYSDIEEIYKNYEWIRLLGKNIIALTDSKDKQLPFGQTLVIE